MAKVNLSEEEKTKLIDLINNSSEVPLDILQKLGPGFFDKLSQEGKFDFATLEKFKVPTLEYAGKRPENVILASAALTGGNAPLQVERCFESGNETNGKSQLTIFEESQKVDKNWRNLIVQGDNLQFLKTCYLNKDPLIKDKVKGKVKLIYIDPPFATKSDFGGKEDEFSYSDKVDRAEFLEGLRERLIFLKDMLNEDGSLILHMDQKMSPYAKVIADEVFGKDKLINEIIWNFRTYQGQTTEYYPQKHNTLYWYIKNRRPKEFKLEYDDLGEDTVDYRRWGKYIVRGGEIRGNRYPSGDSRFMAYYNRWVKENGRLPNKNDVIFRVQGYVIDDVWIDIPAIDPKDKEEKTGYPTQKPEMLLERLIQNLSGSNDIVLDCFAGSGTTGAVAEKLGRRWIMCDFGKHAIYTMQKRMLRIAESKKLGQNAKHDKGPMPFCVASCGGYDFTRIMNLRENKDAYITFVLGLFNLSRTEENYLKKYRLPNIYGEKENNPVEVYPVWENEYLKNVKIDGEYLQGIIDQTGGKIKGDYYIITPVSCSNVADTTLENEKHEPVNFKILSFPYKILEEASRSFEIKEQPSSSKNINDLITSVGFYFNEQVEVSAKKTTGGFQITKFKSEITDGSGNKYEGIAGLAMVLVDKDYNGKVFDMEQAVYSADIKEDGKIKTPGITSSTHIIAIDKHGNESKITAVK